ncbi:coiled-coil domain-containing protein 81-like [Pipra filicauda]|uniref:Coiled-coil domain-containing protein 81-like n=1 Tax=Pipra filicauda TaxID=649802 RepID=A0A6J2IDW5_9PASS|nr:coiled-coil domain-containing protein 81-like [Pipra filicauda]
MAVATQDQTGNVSQAKMDFWDGMESVFMMPNITPTERRAVWNAVSRYVQRQLLQHKGIRVPTLGSFDVVHTEIPVGDRTVTLQRPMFYLARNLGGVSNLMDNNIDLTGDKPLEPLKYAQVAVEASVSRRKAESCILGTTSLLYHCLAKGAGAAFVLRDVGVLLIEGRRAHMRFYPDFLEEMTGKKIQDRATMKVLQQLDLVVSRDVPVASLALTSRLLIFPEFEPVGLPLSLLRDHLRACRDVPGGDKGKQTESLPPVGRRTEGRFPGLAMPAGSTTKADKQPWHEGGEEMKDSSGIRMWPQTPPSLVKGQSRATERKQPLRGAGQEEMEKQKILLEEKEKRKFILEEKYQKIPLEKKEKRKFILEEKEHQKIPLEKKEERKFILEEKEHQKVPLENKEKRKFILEEKHQKIPLEKKEKRKFILEEKEHQKVPLEEKEKGKFILEEKVSVVLAPGPEPAQGLRPRPEAFWSVMKEPQKSILAGYRFEPALFVPPLHPEGPPAPRSPVLKKTEVVARGLWPWME